MDLVSYSDVLRNDLEIPVYDALTHIDTFMSAYFDGSTTNNFNQKKTLFSPSHHESDEQQNSMIVGSSEDYRQNLKKEMKNAEHKIAYWLGKIDTVPDTEPPIGIQ